MKTDRKYSYKDVDMLMSVKTLCKNFENHKAEIIALRATWADPFITNFQARIDNAISTYLGQDPKKELRIATQTLKQIQENAKRDLSLFKIQIEVDYSADKVKLNELLTTLGFVDHYKNVLTGDQEALIELLYSFKTNMTAAQKTELTDKGIDGNLIDSIIAYADPLKEANTIQENLKGTTKELTEEAMLEFNAIYAQAMAICRICTKLFKDRTVIKNKFVFRKIARRLNKSKGIEKPDIRRGIEEQLSGDTEGIE